MFLSFIWFGLVCGFFGTPFKARFCHSPTGEAWLNPFFVVSQAFWQPALTLAQVDAVEVPVSSMSL
jgi:hypothetical protein